MRLLLWKQTEGTTAALPQTEKHRKATTSRECKSNRRDACSIEIHGVFSPSYPLDKKDQTKNSFEFGKVTSYSDKSLKFKNQ